MLRSSAGTAKDVLELFRAAPTFKKIAESTLEKNLVVYGFDPIKREIVDISNLDSFGGSPDEATWGGLAEFSGHAHDVIARVVAKTLPHAAE